MDAEYIRVTADNFLLRIYCSKVPYLIQIVFFSCLMEDVGKCLFAL